MKILGTAKNVAISAGVTLGLLYLATRLVPGVAGFILWPGGPWLTNPMNLLRPPSMSLGLNGVAKPAGASANGDPDSVMA